MTEAPPSQATLAPRAMAEAPPSQAAKTQAM